MNTTRFSTVHRTQAIMPLFILVAFMQVIVGIVGLRQAQAETSVKFISDNFEGNLVSMDDEITMREAVAVTIQNTGSKEATITFCALPKGESQCPTAGSNIEIVPPEPAGPTILKPRTIRSLNLIARMKETVRGAPIEQQSGWLILRSNGKDAGAIPFELTPEAPSHLLSTILTTKRLIWGALIIALIVVVASMWPICREPESDKNKLPVRALFSLPMGVAEWKIENSWAANLSIFIGVVGGIAAVLPDALKTFKSEFGSLVFLFTVMAAIGAFIYNISTKPGPEKEEGKDTYRKRGLTGVFLLSSWLIICSLVGQLGLQMIAADQLRGTEKNIPDLFLAAFEVAMLILVVFAAWFCTVKLRETIRAQEIETHKKAYKQRARYKRTVKQISDYTKELLDHFDIYPLDLEKTKKGFAEIVRKQSPPDDEDYAHLSALFIDNLPFIFDACEKKEQDMMQLLKSIGSEADEAKKFLSQTLPAEDAVAAFYESLWIPPDLRKKYYIETIDKIIRHVRVARAQAYSRIEPDMVLGPNQELFTNVKATLGELNKACGFVGDRDPYYANLKKLFEITKAKWEVLTISELRIKLDDLTSTTIEGCRSKLVALYDVSPPDDKGANLAMTLKPLAAALGEDVPYQTPFPVNVKDYKAEKGEMALMTQVAPLTSAYYAPDEESSKRRFRDLRNSSMMKVQGQNVQVL